MKKAIRKTLSATLAMLLLLSVLPMATFAAEIEVHEHSTACCAEAGVSPAAFCTHEYLQAEIVEVYYVAMDANYHYYGEALVSSCTRCPYKTYEFLIDPPSIEAHDMDGGVCRLCDYSD